MSPRVSVPSLLDASLTLLATHARIALTLLAIVNLAKLVACTEHHQHSLESSVPMTSRSHLSQRHHIGEHLGDVVGDIDDVSADELQFLYFKMHDSDGDERLDGNELVDSLLHFHVEDGAAKVFTSGELVDMIDPILSSDDGNSDGFIDYREFVAAQKARRF